MNAVTQKLKQYFAVTREQEEKLAVIAQTLKAGAKNQNLTALKTDDEIAILHLYDSLTLLGTGLFSGKKVIDVGSGAGFPALPLAACTDCNVYANDSTAKKLEFIKDCAQKAGITNLRTINGRAEDLGLGELRGGFDIAVSRGVARLNILCELCMPLVRRGGYFVAMKGRAGAEEEREAAAAIKKLGGRTAEVIEIPIPEFDRLHTVIVIEKTADTPKEYPRAYAKISASPL